jgi:hypothetical protein
MLWFVYSLRLKTRLLMGNKVMLFAVAMAELEIVLELTRVLRQKPLLLMKHKLPANLKLPTNLWCECKELGLYLMAEVFVNVNSVFNLLRFCVDLDLRGFRCYCSKHSSW